MIDGVALGVVQADTPVTDEFGCWAFYVNYDKSMIES